MKPYYQDDYVTIYHGDCREILPELPKVDLVLTDPPYGVNKAGWDSVFCDLSYWQVIYSKLKDRGNLLLFTGLLNLPIKLNIIASVFEYQWAIGWYKPNAMQFGKTGYSKNDLITWWAKGKGKVVEKFIDVIITNMGLPEDKFNHPTVKPMSVINSLIMSFTEQANLILDPFLGSGTTAYCAKKLNRKCIGIEIEEKYCEIAANRCRQMVFKL